MPVTSLPNRPTRQDAPARPPEPARGPVAAYAYGAALAWLLGAVVPAVYRGDAHLAQQRLSEAHGHLSLVLFALALAARPLARRWAWPLRNRRALGVLAFLYAAAHTWYAFGTTLGGSLETLEFLAPATRDGIVAGLASLLLMLPLFLTSNDLSQRLLRRNWGRLHRLLVAPALLLAVMHTVLIGVHYGLQPFVPASAALVAAVAALVLFRNRRSR